MPSLSQLSITTRSVLCLLKEEISYEKKRIDKEAQVKVLVEKIKSGRLTSDGNEEFMLKLQQTTAEDAKAVLEPLKQKIADATALLQEQIATSTEEKASEVELEQAKIVLGHAWATKNWA